MSTMTHEQARNDAIALAIKHHTVMAVGYQQNDHTGENEWAYCRLEVVGPCFVHTVIETVDVDGTVKSSVSKLPDLNGSKIGVVEHSDSGTSFSGENAVDLYRLILLKSGLKLEMKCPGMKMSRHISALKAAKQITGLRSNDRAVQLATVEQMIARAEGKVVHVER